MNGETCRFARIVLGGVAPIPWRVPEAETVLTGQKLTPGLAAQGRRNGACRRATARQERL
jgi:CO/xanthine dehydrogenase FAD-binding subunit